MRFLAWLSVSAVSLVAAAPPDLQVLRVSPTDTAEPTTSISVTFDRPVAGQLDGTVDPRTILTFTPAVTGRAEWRDPITLVFTPAAPLRPGISYHVSVANSFRAMDGSRLSRPHTFSFSVSGARPLDGSPVGVYTQPEFLAPDAEFEILVSSPVNLEEAAQRVRVELLPPCLVTGTLGMVPVAQRAVNDRDPQRYRYVGDWRRDRRADALRRVIRLRPERPLPAGCQGSLVSALSLEGAGAGQVQWPFKTYGPLRLHQLGCTNAPLCPAGFVTVAFSTPVKGADVQRAVRLSPRTAFTVGDTASVSAWWTLEAPLRTRTRYTVTVDPSLRDVFGQVITGPRAMAMTTTGYEPSIRYPTGRMLVERESFRTLAVRHVNVDTLLAVTVAVPESLEARVLAAPQWNLDDLWRTLEPLATTRAVRVSGALDTPLVSPVKLPAYNAARPGAATITAVRIARREADGSVQMGGLALVQVTNLGLAAKLGTEEVAVSVWTVSDGRPRPQATVVLRDRAGRERGRGMTDAAGLARITGLTPDTGASQRGFEGYLEASFENDRTLLGFDGYSWELNPWRFNVASAYGAERVPAAAAVFTERGIYRPGETVFAKAIVRTGLLGSLRVPERGDSIRWTFADREEGKLKDTVVTASAFGTSDQSLRLAAGQALGTYQVTVALKREGAWLELGRAAYRVAEYRPPEFLVAIAADTAGRLSGDTLTATVEARYLFGAPMARAAMAWTARRVPLWPWEIEIPGAEQYEIGEGGWWWEEDDAPASGVQTISSGTDTLDGSGRTIVRLPLGTPARGRAARVSFQATVTDVNRQSVSSTTTLTLHPAAFYLAARSRGDYFWRSGEPVDIDVLALRPDGQRTPGVAVSGRLVRREWHQVQRRRDGLDELVGEWVADTVARCDLTTSAQPASCRFTPERGGTYVAVFKARDAAGREATTSFYRWATGPGWVAWGDESQFKMDVIPDRTRYDVGDTATVLLASPLTGVDAWLSIEREGIIEQRRVRLDNGATSVRIPLTEAFVPNAFVSVVLARGRSAPAGGIADPGRPALRVGYAELKVTPGVKRLAVTVQPRAAEYRPGDSARVRLRVRDARGAGARSEVTLWAVDEGVLSLTGYRTPDPVDLLYRARGIALRLGSNLTAVAAQVADSEGVSLKGERAPGGGGGREGGDVLRSRFSSTAFFLGSVVTDQSGTAEVAARLPDNLTTFRVMAVAVTAGDRYGSGQSELLVTRPLLARPALPRFLRREDRFLAGVVVNQRAGGTPTVQARAAGTGVGFNEAALKTARLAAGRGTEVRWALRTTGTDSAALRFDVSSGADSDAVLARLPVRPSHVPRAHTASGVVRFTTTAELDLPRELDPARSRLEFSIGTSPLAVIGGMSNWLAVYPFACTEQLTDALLPLIALHRAGNRPDGQPWSGRDARRDIESGIEVLSRRQRTDGGIGLWSSEGWSTPWLSSHAGEVLLAARDAGYAVNDAVLQRLADYLYRSVHQPVPVRAPVLFWHQDLRARLAEQVAAVDFLSRVGRTDEAGENELIRVAAQLAWEDRVRLAEIVARRNTSPARSLLEPLLAGVRVDGRRAILPDSAIRPFYFWSSRRPAARLLSAILAIEPGHTLVGPLVETLLSQARTSRAWNTQDYGAAIEALVDFTARQRHAARRGFSVTANGQVLFRAPAGGETQAGFSRALTGLLVPGPDSAQRLALTVAAPASGQAIPLYFYATVHEVPRARQVTPSQQGIVVERWYEDYNTRRPVISVPEGSLVRVKLRVTITDERHFLALTDPLPAGLEAIDLSLRTAGELPGPAAQGPAAAGPEEGEEGESGDASYGWYYGSWDSGWWSPFDHREMRDDRVAWVATYLWPGTYTATYVARATTPGVFVRPPAHAEEMYNPSTQGRSDGGEFTVTRRSP